MAFLNFPNLFVKYQLAEEVETKLDEANIIEFNRADQQNIHKFKQYAQSSQSNVQNRQK